MAHLHKSIDVIQIEDSIGVSWDLTGKLGPQRGLSRSKQAAGHRLDVIGVVAQARDRVSLFNDRVAIRIRGLIHRTARAIQMLNLKRPNRALAGPSDRVAVFVTGVANPTTGARTARPRPRAALDTATIAIIGSQIVPMIAGFARDLTIEDLRVARFRAFANVKHRREHHRTDEHPAQGGHDGLPEASAVDIKTQDSTGQSQEHRKHQIPDEGLIEHENGKASEKVAILANLTQPELNRIQKSHN